MACICTTLPHDGLEMYVQGRLVPNREGFLIFQPLAAVVSQAQVEVEHEFGKNQAHLGISETIDVANDRLACNDDFM